MKRTLLAFVVIASLLSGCATGSSDSNAELDEANQRIADLEAEASTSTTAAPESEAPVTTAAPTTAAPTTAAPTTQPPETAPPTTAAPEALMPDVVCMNLQDAQDFIQSETGVFLSLSEDATGQGRNQVMDSNWVVVDQRPAVGTPIGEGDAVLSAVKIDEPSPC